MNTETIANRIAVKLVDELFAAFGENAGGEEWEKSQKVAIFFLRQLRKYAANTAPLDLVIKNIKSYKYD